MSEKHRKEIESLLNKSESGVNKRLQKLYKELAEETTQDIIKLAKEIEETDKFSKKLQKERLEAIRSQMYAKANQLEGTQKENIYDFLRHDGQVAFNELFYDFEMTEKIPLSFTMLTDKQINVIINTPIANRKLSTRLKGNSTKMKQNLNRVLTRGFAKGLSTQKMAVQIAEIGGANYRRAMNIARTESGRVTSVARQQSQNHAKSLGLKLEKQWISTLDKLTRSNHQILDGKKIDIDAYFEIAGHKALQPHMFGVAAEDCNCRCRTITIVNEMGPELRRDNESKEVGEYKNYEEWLASKGSKDESHSDNIKIENPIQKLKRPKRRDYNIETDEGYNQYMKDRDGYRNAIKERDEWLDKESERFYNERLKNISPGDVIIKNINELGLKTAHLESLDPVALDSLDRGINIVKNRYPDFIESLGRDEKLKYTISVDSNMPYHHHMSTDTLKLRINKTHYTNEDDYKNLIRSFIDNHTSFENENWFAVGDVFTQIYVHEFGHEFEQYLEKKTGRKLWNNISETFEVKTVLDLPFVSEYGKTEKWEWFAEMFSQGMTGKGNESIDKFMSMLDSLYEGK